jgi:adenylosuccinate synthase
MINGMTEIAITKLDVLSTFDEIKVATRYNLDGKSTDRFPSDFDKLDRAEPVYETFAGWNCDISSCKTWDDLPESVKNYLNFVSKETGVPISYVSTGPRRSETIRVKI